MADNSKTLYCICQTSNGTGFMIQCDKCEDWFHGKCIHVSRRVAAFIETYNCEKCIEAEPSLRIIYKEGYFPQSETKKLKKIAKVGSNNNKRKSEINDVEKKLTTAKPTQLRQSQQQEQSSNDIALNTNNRQKSSLLRKKPGPKGKSRGHHHPKQCNNPDCCYEARSNSIYCSDECGISFNKARYHKFLLPKVDLANKTYKDSAGRTERLKYWGILGDEKKKLIQRINELKQNRDDLQSMIKKIKEEATRLYKPKTSRDKETDHGGDTDSEENDDVLSGDATKTYCVTCGATILANQALRHWAICHKKNEDSFNFTGDRKIEYNFSQEDEEEILDRNPELRCEHVDKKSKERRYCMNLKTACPLHTNWSGRKDEVCGCPLNIIQKLELHKLDGKYCTELKRDCSQHYHWEHFRLAQIDMERLQAFTKLEEINVRMAKAREGINDCFGGVIGLMLHETMEIKDDIQVD